MSAIGDKSKCTMCGEEIVFVSDYWKHTQSSPRHPAIPVEDASSRTLLEELIFLERDGWRKEEARAELDSLRAAAAERDEWKAKYELAFRVAKEKQDTCDDLKRNLDALYATLALATDQAYYPGVNFDAHEAITQLQERIAEQAAQYSNERE